MTRVLIVDDDPSQLRLLARAISARGGGDVEVATAESGAHAIASLQQSPVDVVLTDLQMPDVDGFAVLAWLVEHQPEVTVFTMTAFPSVEASQRLRALGGVECFTKPLHVGTVLSRLRELTDDGVRGQLQNISIVSFLQLMEMERKTCTLTVRVGDDVGELYLRDGALVHAQAGDLQGTEAAIHVCGWRSPSISLVGGCWVEERTVHETLNFILMEAMRMVDEADRAPASAEPSSPAPEAWSDDETDWSELSEELEAMPVGPEDAASLSSSSPSSSPSSAGSKLESEEQLAPPPLEALAPTALEGVDVGMVALVDVATGTVGAASSEAPMLGRIAQLVAEMYRQQVEIVARLDESESIEEVVVTTGTMTAVARPTPARDQLALVLADTDEANMAMLRVGLQRFLEQQPAGAFSMPVPTA